MTSFLREVAICTKATLIHGRGAPWTWVNLPLCANKSFSSHLREAAGNEWGLVALVGTIFFVFAKVQTAHAQHRREPTGAILDWTSNVVLLFAEQRKQWESGWVQYERDSLWESLGLWIYESHEIWTKDWQRQTDFPSTLHSTSLSDCQTSTVCKTARMRRRNALPAQAVAFTQVSQCSTRRFLSTMRPTSKPTRAPVRCAS